MNENDGKQRNKPSHFLIRPDYDDPQGVRQAAIDMFEAIRGRESTAEELAELDATIKASSEKSTSTDPTNGPQ